MKGRLQFSSTPSCIWLTAEHTAIMSFNLLLVFRRMLVVSGVAMCESMSSQLYNVARGKPAYQIDVYGGHTGPASKAVDGLTVGHIDHCSHTQTNTGWMWWMVDLQQQWSIRKVQLYNRFDGLRKLISICSLKWIYLMLPYI